MNRRSSISCSPVFDRRSSGFPSCAHATRGVLDHALREHRESPSLSSSLSSLSFLWRWRGIPLSSCIREGVTRWSLTAPVPRAIGLSGHPLTTLDPPPPPPVQYLL